MKTYARTCGYFGSSATSILSWAFLACLALGSLAAGSARANTAGACASGTIATVLGTTCTIGDKTFDFNYYYPYSYGTASDANAAADVTFTPLTSNPLAPGFELGAFSSTDVSGYTYEYGYLGYNVSVTDGSANLIGINAQANDPTVAAAAETDSNYQVAAGNYAYNYLYSVPAYAYTSQYAEQYQYFSSYPYNYNSSYSSGPAMFGPVSSGNGEALFETWAYDYNYSTGNYGGGGTAEAAMPSVDYTFLEQTDRSPVPEPGTLVLFGSGLISIVGFARRKIFQA